MTRNRYKIFETDFPYLVTCTIVEWLDLLKPEIVKQIIIESLRYLKIESAIKLFAYVIMHNHIHLIISSDNIVKNMCRFKSFTARQIIDYYKGEINIYKNEHYRGEPVNEENDRSRAEPRNNYHLNPSKCDTGNLRTRLCPAVDGLEIIKILHNINPEYHISSEHQFWQEGYCPKQIMNFGIFQQKINYIHLNPIRKGYVDSPEEWKWSSANPNGLIEIDPVWD